MHAWSFVLLSKAIKRRVNFNTQVVVITSFVTKLANSRRKIERYPANGLDKSHRLSNTSELCFILLIISLGVIITTITAIKAKGKSNLTRFKSLLFINSILIIIIKT
jgi:hypothetical protein